MGRAAAPRIGEEGLVRSGVPGRETWVKSMKTRALELSCSTYHIHQIVIGLVLIEIWVVG